VNLSWQDNATNETGYEVRRGPVGSTVVAIATLQTNAQSYSDTNLPGDMIWEYVAAACNQQVCSTSDRVMGFTTPAAPTGLAVLLNDPGSQMFRLGWTDASAAETAFRIERLAPTTGLFAPVATLAAGTTQYDGTGTPNSTETYRVAACNPAGCAVSSTVTLVFAAGPPIAITQPTTTGTEMNGITDGNGELHDWWFEYYYDATFVDAFTTSPVSTTAGGLKTENLVDLASGQVWYYRIVASNSAGTTYGSAQVLTAPILDNLGPSTANVCLLGTGCMIDPPTITFQASTVTTQFGPDPFQVVMFNIESPTFHSLPSTSVTFFDDPDGYRIYTYTVTVDASMISGLNPGAHQAVARGYPASSSGNVITMPMNFNVTTN
jgi:hypothetical protein